MVAREFHLQKVSNVDSISASWCFRLFITLEKYMYWFHIPEPNYITRYQTFAMGRVILSAIAGDIPWCNLMGSRL